MERIEAVRGTEGKELVLCAVTDLTAQRSRATVTCTAYRYPGVV